MKPNSVSLKLKTFLFLFCFLSFSFCKKIGSDTGPESNLPNTTKRPNVIWIVIDSLRGDIIGRYGVTPNLEMFAENAVTFKYHLVNAAWTRPSTLVFFTGKYASANPVNFWDYPTTKSEVDAFYRSEKRPLPKLLKDNSFVTYMVGNNPFLTDKFGLGVDVGFDQLYDFSNYREDTKKITKKTFEVLEEISSDKKPFFLFLNYNDPHKPYTPPQGFTNRIRTNEILDERKMNYLGEVAFVDEELGKVFEELKNKNLWDNTLILITADHGEVMHSAHAISPFTGTNTYYGHGQDLFLENIHVPLLIKLPGANSKQTIQTMTRSIDLFPTVLDYSGLPIPNNIQGKSLKPLIENKESTKRTYYGETRFTQGYGEGHEFLLQRSYRFHELGKFWLGSVGSEFYLYSDTKKDPNQENPLRIANIAAIQDMKLQPDLEKKILRFWKQIRSMEPKLPLYHLSIQPESKDTEIQIRVPSGTIRMASYPNDVLLEEKGKFVQIHTKRIEPFEISFEVYPDVSFPEFNVWLSKKQIPKSEIFIGYFGVSMASCQSNCDLLYESGSKKPVITPKTKVYFWKEGGQKKSYASKQELGTDALEILKKQGYVQ
ncbi:sulfatase [Leptospira sp. 2 VSF19]|uniref:Sulfatase n=1 Tax=Leptospira soteropolitanensis TaxID=2950025 RepID=A0AAW5VR65_9LEPT|nr:sulfatase [Leptospira soteropolitanensis]MCW7494601.1 sulfatase [Leptospira soteropolitanensis]MCW7502195.1 sulfatase [Leptospira soteropolitanensis]MCW7524375.1 sulfatase [Leptospira soteropolitanensis]MCW7528241.1 sulfatase [Leptospira soteropolitanensis]MCW7532166.1 sulfatase [Leptospira soteropolitanensis]